MEQLDGQILLYNSVKILCALQKPSKIILGIDPGTLLMGYGIIEINSGAIILKEMSVLKLPGKNDNYSRLQLIHKKIEELISKHRPHEFAIEAPFFGNRVQPKKSKAIDHR